jgi:dipeptidyl aminopeptidase/acylaminoacyl peptidase
MELVLSHGSGFGRRFGSWLIGLSLLVFPFRPEMVSHPTKRRVTVRDAIEMTRWADRRYFLGGSPDDRVGLFSPDGKRFLVVLEKGDLERNIRKSSVLLFRTDEAFDSPVPEVLLTMAASSNRDPIAQVKWLEDNQTFLFLGEHPGETSAVYRFSIRTKRLEKLTNHPSPILTFDTSKDGEEIVYLAAASEAADEEATKKGGLVITSQNPSELFACDHDPYQKFEVAHRELFLERSGEGPALIWAADFFSEYLPMSVSPSGRYALVSAYVRDIPPSWRRYQDPVLHPYIIDRRRPGVRSNVRRYLLLETQTRSLTPLVDAPTYWKDSGFAWAPDEKSVAVSGTYLSLDTAGPAEQAVREKMAFVVEVALPGREVRKITNKELKVLRWAPETRKLILGPGPQWQKIAPVGYSKSVGEWSEVPLTEEDTRSRNSLDVSLEENIETPPKVFVSEPRSQRRTLLFDLNPQFRKLQFGRVEAVRWKATDGHEVLGGLYLPPDYKAGERYPLVIQTHGFKPDRFWIDGPWSSAFAAQPLAASGIVVLQVGGSADPGEDLKAANSPDEAPRQMAAYEGAIDALDARGLIDRSRVGIIGFSRTVFYVEYALTHSKYPFRAASLADGFDGGYLNYLLWPDASYVLVNGGPPFGASLDSWLKNSPGFNLERVTAAVHLEYYGAGAALGGWQWYSGLSLLGKPVDFIWLPGGTHLLVKPWDRRASQERNVDWFRFWLKEEEDPNPAKGELYKSWHEMRELLRHSNENEKRIGQEDSSSGPYAPRD